MALELRQDSDRFTLLDSDLVADGDPGVTYTVRPLTASAAAKIRQKVGRSQQEAIFAILDYCLESWTGVEVNGEPAPCDRDHKVMLPLSVASEIVERASARLTGQESAKRESFRSP
jgi:hypothetical protein